MGALAIGLATGPAQAQQADTQDSAGAADPNIIVVTAQKRAENLQEVPIAISALSSAYLEARDITSIDSIGAVAPNVKFERAPGSGTIAQIAIRGSVTINPAVTWEPAVGLYLDGVYIAKNQGAIFDVADLERVEILRGPQGTLYGRNSLAGAVNLVTAKPTGELGGKLEVSYGNYDYKRAKATLNLPAIGPFSIKLSGQISKRDGFYDIQDNPFPAAAPFAQPASVKDAQSLNGRSAMVQVRFEPTDNLTFDYAYDYSKYDQRPSPGQLLRVNQNGDPRDIFDPNSANYIGIPLGLFANPERQDTLSINASPFAEYSRIYGHALTATLDLGAAELKSITAYRDLRFVDTLELDGSPVDIAQTSRITDMNSFSQELQLTGSAIDDRLHYVLGAFYYDESAGTVNPQKFFGVFGPGANRFDSRYASNTTAWAAYAQADFKITEALKLTLGGRYTKEKKDISRFLQILNSPPTPAFTVADVQFGDLPDAKFSNFSPAATLSYEVNRDVNVYARFARGFKSGGFNGETNTFVAPTPDCPTGTPELCNPYRPEKVDSYEVGLKTVLADGAMTLNIAGFYDKHKDIQLSVFDAGGAAASTVLNAGAATIKGIEIETIIRPAPWLTFNGSFAYLDAKYDSFIDGGIDVSDNRAFPHTPKYSVSAGFDWRVLEGSWGRFNILGDLSMVSKYHTFPYALSTTNASDQVAADTQSPGRTMVNMTASLTRIPIGGVEAKISAWVRNLTNEDAPSNFIDFGPDFGGILIGYFPDPRTFGLTVGMEF
ncbi:TonB-dependent receptor [Sphingopyxis witflariensis]|nr:TonB-dependent receptor [Sphingopyxis witflariensis]